MHVFISCNVGYVLISYFLSIHVRYSYVEYNVDTTDQGSDKGVEEKIPYKYPTMQLIF